MDDYNNERQSYNRPPGAPPGHGYGQQGGRYEQEGHYEQQQGFGQHQQGGRYEQEGYGQQGSHGGRFEQGYGQQQGGRYDQEQQFGAGGHSGQQGTFGQRPQQGFGQPQVHQAAQPGVPRPAANDAGDDFESFANFRPGGSADMGGVDPSMHQQQLGGGNHAGIGRPNWRPPTDSAAMHKQKFQYSACTGRRRALLIGINYRGQKGELRGCINDVINLRNFLQKHGYDHDVTVLTDDQNDPNMLPTKANIQRWMSWLHTDAGSGHGVQVQVDNQAEADGLGEAICPLDHEQVGMILDMEIYQRLVKPLPAGCRLTAIFDACHSGSAMNLPYMYSTKGTVKEPNFAADGAKALLKAGMGYAKDGNTGTAMSSLFGAAKSMFKEKQAGDLLREQNTSEADVISWSGCKDDQTSADTTEEGQATGAMSYAFVKALTNKPEQSYIELLQAVRKAMVEGGYTQKPQLSACHPIDTDLDFVA
ncbi:hypothetical protein CC85DRAFT_325854 [Cutaneotrichosporon oleaginosum]|uniref:Peptidase C14 caspase domain-containing protein n=1 Tax=Cutaneotrichosporon oleaginosum TaxID=879819 RepID=A0A0J0XW76_9TREE|nr:uncharacterized protein CC85DRAFT_325854 [Cutaneotrichosporon oleaginosum]KLT45347.1 hypothetical protein CC85DRAFT_325854 [Cutaneotrichosporon oleaginosum]TXT14827.1 hypothetical protein COLE_01020 [Cutaneotrichosporon oleaginosum]